MDRSKKVLKFIAVGAAWNAFCALTGVALGYLMGKAQQTPRRVDDLPKIDVEA